MVGFSVPDVSGDAIAFAGPSTKPLQVDIPSRSVSLRQQIRQATGAKQSAGVGLSWACGVCGLLAATFALSSRSKRRRLSTTVRAAAPGTAWKGAKPIPLALSAGLGLLIRFALPVPSGVAPQAWSVLALFVATVCGVVTEPLPAPGVALCALAVGLMSGVLSFAEGVEAFTDPVIWLVLLAFFFAKGFKKTGFGDRVALSVVRACGSTPMGLAYGLNAAEATIAAGMPSSAARAAGIFYPLACSVARATGSDPADGTERRTGAFLVQSTFQATGNSSCLWLYGAAQNLLILRLAEQLGYGISSPFVTWTRAMSVPALTAMLLTPQLAAWLLPPQVKTTSEAQREAARLLKAKGPVSRDEAVLAATLVGMLVLWCGSSSFGIPAVHTAVLGLAILLLTGTLTWDDCVSEKNAWTTMTWFAILISLSSMLNKLGIVHWFASSVSSQITAMGLSTLPAYLLLLLLYSFSHYFFASQVAHVSAFYTPFVAMMVQVGTPPPVAVLSLAVVSNLFASLTPYASAQAPVFFNGGYMSQGEFYRVGLAFLVFNIAIWLAVGSIWWRFLGLY